jgi:peptide/nickel transport system substrate-binding protein
MMNKRNLFTFLGAVLATFLMITFLLDAAALASGRPAEPPDPLATTITTPDTIDFVVEPDAAQAIARLEAGEIDLYAAPIWNSEQATLVAASPHLDSYKVSGNYFELTFNPAGPVFSGNGKLNPFAVPRVRQAMNWLIDRDHIAQQIMGGLASPSWLPLHTVSQDYADLAQPARALELQYAYNLLRAQQVIGAEMGALGASLVAGKWHYNGQPVELILLIRIEDERRAIGDYIGDQLESIGFSVIRNYQDAAGVRPIWYSTDPNEGLFHIYTGAWLATIISRDEAIKFAYFYTDMGPLDSPLWQAYVNTPEFYELARRLNEREFASLEERTALMTQGLAWAMEDSVRLWLLYRQGVVARRQEVEMSADLFGGVSGSHLWAQTAQWTTAVTPTTPLTIAVPLIPISPWNPLDGSNFLYERMALRATGENGTVPDPFTGLAWPQRIDQAALFVAEGIPVRHTLPWVTLQHVPEIIVPPDAWVGWDATAQQFLTAAEVYDEPQTALVKSVVTYPADLTDSMTWHDGSPFSVADIVLRLILTFDRAQPESAIYDPSAVEEYNYFMSTFRGVRILSEQPLVIEYYSDQIALDAELMVVTWWPAYTTGPGAWHNLAVGMLAEAAGEAAFSSSKANAQEVEWLNYVGGPSLTLLAGQLNTAQAGNYIPYAPTLGQYVTPDEAVARWANLVDWYAARGHFWLGTGPFYLAQVQPDLGRLQLQRYPAHPDAPDRWQAFLAAPVPEVAVEGPESVTQGETAVYTITITNRANGQPYPPDDLESVSYLVVDSFGNTRLSGDAVPLARDATLLDNGLWQVVLDGAQTAQLPGGTNRLEITVKSRQVVIVGFDGQAVAAPFYYSHLPFVVRQP